MAKKMDNKKAVMSGVNFLELLFLLFLGLKLAGKINWNWWLVFSPIWGPLALIIALLVVILLGIGVEAIIDGFTKKGDK